MTALPALAAAAAKPAPDGPRSIALQGGPVDQSGSAANGFETQPQYARPATPDGNRQDRRMEQP